MTRGASVDDDTAQAAWAQIENEAQRWQEELTNDDGYLAWLASLETQRKELNYGDYCI